MKTRIISMLISSALLLLAVPAFAEEPAGDAPKAEGDKKAEKKEKKADKKAAKKEGEEKAADKAEAK